MTNPTSEKHPDRFHQLMMGALDHELSAQEQQEFEGLLASSSAWQKEWNEQKQLKELMTQMQFNEPPEEVWDSYWTGVYSRLERKVAWVLVSIGAMILIGYGAFKATESIWADPKLPPVIKWAIFALLAGGIILCVSVVREKLLTRKADKYKEIQR